MPKYFQIFIKKEPRKVRNKFNKKFLPILALDSTTITLTRKLFHQNNYREAKLLCSQNSETKIPEDISIKVESPKTLRHPLDGLELLCHH